MKDRKRPDDRRTDRSQTLSLPERNATRFAPEFPNQNRRQVVTPRSGTTRLQTVPRELRTRKPQAVARVQMRNRRRRSKHDSNAACKRRACRAKNPADLLRAETRRSHHLRKIGRASCRERV